MDTETTPTPTDFERRLLAAARSCLDVGSAVTCRALTACLDLYKEKEVAGAISIALAEVALARAGEGRLAAAGALRALCSFLDLRPWPAATAYTDSSERLAVKLLLAVGVKVVGFPSDFADDPRESLRAAISRRESRIGRSGLRGIPSLPRRSLD